MPLRPVADLAFARPGDKGDVADVTVFARDESCYAALEAELTAERVAAAYSDLVRGGVTRYPVPGLRALKFVMTEALGGGGPSSLRADNLGKALGGAVLRVAVPVDDGLDAALPPRPRPPDDPYADAPWRVG